MKTTYIGLVSDSHGRIGQLEKMVQQAPDVCAWVHAGDYCEDAEALAEYAGVPVYAVLGNNDYMSRGQVPERRAVRIAGITIAVIHGNQWYGEKRLEKLIELGRNSEAQLVMFGHTHRRFLLEKEGLLIVNPGSIGLPRDNRRGTYAIASVSDGIVRHVNFYELA